MMTILLMMIFSPLIFYFCPLPLILMLLQNLILIMVLILIMCPPLFFTNPCYWNIFTDYYSYPLLLLTLWITSLMIMSLINMNFKKLYLFNILMLLSSLLLSFSMINLFQFYLFFEISMIPTFFLIIGWGGQFERMEAGLYMFLYTIFASLPLMIIIINMYNQINHLNMLLMMNSNILNNFMSYLYLTLSFLIKLPMFMFHLWLPKAHVEAPISGSMILAAIMLKLGGYGILRTMLFMENNNIKFMPMIIILSMMGALMISIMCMKQIDMKMLVAYSSIVHMGMMISSLLIMTYISILGSMLMMIGHGLCSSALFCLVNINYERTKSRSLILNKGMMNMMPSLTLFWFLTSIFNMASPPSMNMFSEIFMINSILTWSFSMVIILMLLSFTSVMYSMFFYSKSQHGCINKNIYTFTPPSIRDYLLISLHLYPLIPLILLF